jgi:uncharacterized protein (TIGR02246 family)
MSEGSLSMRAILIPMLVLVAGCAGSDASLPSPAELQSAASEALGRFSNSWNSAAAGDTAGATHYGTLYWPDAELVDPSGVVWDGQLAIVQMHRDLWAGPFRASRVSGSVRRVRSLSATLMIADFDMELALAGSAPPGLAGPDGIVRTHLKHVMESRRGQWKVVAAQNTFVFPAPPR